MVAISQVPRGLACDCVCPACGVALVARKGVRTAHHFAHHRKGPCAAALETSLHRMAKVVIKEALQLAVPPVRLYRIEKPVQAARLLSFQTVQIERPLNGMVPDLLLRAGPGKLVVEVAFHHTTDWSKIKILQQMKMRAVEINLKRLYQYLCGLGKGADMEAFREEVVHGLSHKKWLYNPLQHQLEHQLRIAADKKRIRYLAARNGISYYVVDDCPEHRRCYRFGRWQRKFYADVHRDCLHCAHCLEIEHHLQHVGYRAIADAPRNVYCLGQLRKRMGDLRKWLWANRRNPVVKQ